MCIDPLSVRASKAHVKLILFLLRPWMTSSFMFFQNAINDNKSVCMYDSWSVFNCTKYLVVEENRAAFFFSCSDSEWLDVARWHKVGVFWGTEIFHHIIVVLQNINLWNSAVLNLFAQLCINKALWHPLITLYTYLRLVICSIRRSLTVATYNSRLLRKRFWSLDKTIVGILRLTSLCDHLSTIPRKWSMCCSLLILWIVCWIYSSQTLSEGEVVR